MNPIHTPRWPELSPLLDEWLDLPEAARTAWLQTLRERDSELAEALAALLPGSQNTGLGRMFDGAAAGMQGDAGLAGRTIGAYVLESALGQGGSGSVWRARRQDGRYDGAVAIKLLHLHMLGRAAATRFQREGTILAQLQHPHIAQLLDAGVTPDGQPYLVLELVDGEPIDRYCDARRLGLDARLALFDDVLAAVASAHAHGVIHRDLKPGNILVSAEGQVKLLDFGIAKLRDEHSGEGEATELTRNDGAPLTPAYAAPEQLQGLPITTRTDVYALGVLLYQLLSGRHPAGDTLTDPRALAHATLETEPPRLSRAVDESFSGLEDHPVKRLRQQLAGDLETIVGHALAKLPGERYAGVAALGEDLRRWREHEPILARAPSLAYRTRKFVRRNRGAVAAAMLSTLAIVAGVIGTVSQAHRAEQEASRARLQAEDSARDASQSAAVLAVLAAALGTTQREPRTMAQLLEVAEASANQQFANEPRALGYVDYTLAGYWYQLGNFPRVQALAERAEVQSRKAGDVLSAAGAACFNASALLAVGKKPEAIVKLDRAIADSQTLSPADGLSLLGCYDMRSGLHGQAGELVPMQKVIDAGLKIIHDSGMTHIETLMLGNALQSRKFQYQDRLADVLRSYEQTLAGLHSLGQDEHSIRSAFFRNFGFYLLVAGQAARAEALLRRTIEIAESGGAEFQDAATLLEHARALQSLGRPAEALLKLERARAINTEQYAAQNLASNAIEIANAQCELGRARACEAELANASDKPDAGRAMVQAKLLLLQHRAQEARVLLEGQQSSLTAAPASRRIEVARQQLLALTAQAELAAGDPKAALETAQKGVAYARKFIQDLPASVWLGDALLAQARAQQALGDTAAAQVSRREAVAQLEAAAGKDAPITEQARQAIAAGK